MFVGVVFSLIFREYMLLMGILCACLFFCSFFDTFTIVISGPNTLSSYHAKYKVNMQIVKNNRRQ